MDRLYENGFIKTELTPKAMWIIMVLISKSKGGLMIFEYELSKQDYIDFNIYHMKNSDTLKRSLHLQQYLLPIFYLIMPFILAGITDIPLVIWLTTFVIVAVLWVIFYPKYFMSSTIKRISKLVDEGKNKDMLGKHCIIVDEDGIVEKTENGESRTKWNGVEKVTETEKYVFIYISSIMAYIIPKSVFVSDIIKNEFLSLLRGKTEQDIKK